MTSTRFCAFVNSNIFWRKMLFKLLHVEHKVGNVNSDIGEKEKKKKKIPSKHL